MKLFTFGDSWTTGQGCNLKIENTINDIEQRKMYRNSMSWPKYLSELLNLEFFNLSESGSSNKKIFDTIIENIKSNNIIENDLIVIMWSSSLRDNLPFFPNGEWHVWGKNYMDKKWSFNWVINSIKNNIIGTTYTSDAKYNFFLKSYKEFYIENLFNEWYYDIVNQNYILYIQKLLESYNIKYIFCDGFDCMVDNNIHPFINKTHFINKLNYYKFGEATLKDYLISMESDFNVWEDNTKWNDTPGKHPNHIGYRLIANELYNFIIKSNVLDKKNKQIPNIL